MDTISKIEAISHRLDAIDNVSGQLRNQNSAERLSDLTEEVRGQLFELIRFLEHRLEVVQDYH